MKNLTKGESVRLRENIFCNDQPEGRNVHIYTTAEFKVEKCDEDTDICTIKGDGIEISLNKSDLIKEEDYVARMLKKIGKSRK